MWWTASRLLRLSCCSGRWGVRIGESRAESRGGGFDRAGQRGDQNDTNGWQSREGSSECSRPNKPCLGETRIAVVEVIGEVVSRFRMAEEVDCWLVGHLDTVILPSCC